MKARSKRYRKACELVNEEKQYRLREAVGVIKQYPRAKFDETVEINFKLGIDPSQSDQNIRLAVNLPNGAGKKVRVLCFVKGEEARAAEAAGAEHVGGEELVEKVLGGWMDFDVLIAHPDLMRHVSKLGRVLGPKGLMPSPKAGTVTPQVGQAVKEVKRGKVELKNDKTAGVNVGVGKLSFEESALLENAQAVIRALQSAKPSSSRGDFIRRASISTSQGPGIRLEIASLLG